MGTIKNQVILIGNLGNDPEVTNFESSRMAKFSMATNETFKKQTKPHFTTEITEKSKKIKINSKKIKNKSKLK